MIRFFLFSINGDQFMPLLMGRRIGINIAFAEHSRTFPFYVYTVRTMVSITAADAPKKERRSNNLRAIM